MPTDEQRLTSWIEHNIGGRVVSIERLQRWRPGWNVDVELDGRLLALHARGERESNFAIPYRIADEAPIHGLLEAHGLPVPHSYGLCDDPYALVMGRLAGDVDLSFAADDQERAALIDEYLSMLPAIYTIPPDALRAAGFEVPASPADVALGSFRNFEQLYDSLMVGRDPIAAFLRRWLHRNAPSERGDGVFVTFDAFQFMFDEGRITGLLDFELACVGDPMMDLASLRIRDTIKNLGDLASIADRFERITGVPVDHDVADYYCVLYNTLTVLSAGPPIAAPVRTTDYVSHMAWYTNSARWAFEVIAEMRGYQLDVVPEPEQRPSRHAPAYAHLSDVLRQRSRERPGDYEAATAMRHARHLARLDAVGAKLAAGDCDDIARLLGRQMAPEDADAELLEAIDADDPGADADMVRLLDRRAQRMHLLLAPPGSLLLRHPRLRSLRPGAGAEVDQGQRWPAGAIPGTARL
jgi:aminoglycoside phosphotransferase (APT) family kinase protein